MVIPLEANGILLCQQKWQDNEHARAHQEKPWQVKSGQKN